VKDQERTEGERCPTCDLLVAEKMPATRSWSLPPEPGPEVTRLRSGGDRRPRIWRSDTAPWWLVQLRPGEEPFAYVWRSLVYHWEPLTDASDASQDTTP
jgi:hypothetical protein